MNSTTVRRQWADRSGEFSPEYYAYYGPNETSDVIRRTLERFLEPTAPVLELGCSSGRHLAHLHNHGFDDLAGIDVNEDAFDVMADAYPDLATDGDFHLGAIEDLVGEFDDNQFGAVYSVETLQHIHPDAAWVFEELARIADDLLITAENEGSANSDQDPDRSTDRAVSYVNDEFPLYHRDWKAIFTDMGFEQVDATTDGQDTIRTFRSTPDRNA